MYLSFARCETSFAAVAEMIVVRADDDYFLFKRWIGAIENADDVGRLHFAADDVCRKCYEDGVQRQSNSLILVFLRLFSS